MPLLKGKSKATFGKNVSEMMEHGHPQAQALAAAYSMKRKKKAHGGCMAEGGAVDSGKNRRDFEKGVHLPPVGGTKKHEGISYAGRAVREGDKEMAHEFHKAVAREKSDYGMAEGGMLTDDGYQSECTEHCEVPCTIHEQASGFVGHEGDDVKRDVMATTEDERMLNQHGEYEEGPTGPWMAEGGQLTDEGYQSQAHDMDMVGRIMAKRQHMYSKGGQVANHTPITAGFDENEFDDLVLRNSDMESADYTGANSGDELDNAGENRRRADMVDRIMLKRMRQRNPGVYKGQVREG